MLPTWAAHPLATGGNMVVTLTGWELMIHPPYLRQSLAWAMLLLAMAQAGGYDVRYYWDWMTRTYSTPEEIAAVREYTYLEVDMSDLDRLKVIAALEAIVDASDAKREQMEAHIAALKQQAAYGRQIDEYQVQLARSKAK